MIVISAASKRAQSNDMPPAPNSVTIVVFPGVNILDVAGPVQVFTTANETVQAAATRRLTPYQVAVVSAHGGLIATTSGIELDSSRLPALAAIDLDTVLIAGGHGAQAAAEDRRLTEWLRSAQPLARRFGCICTGAFLLARAGMLNGRRVATHWAYCDQLQADYPGLNVERDAIFVEEDGFWSSAGVTSGMDLALAMVEQDLGREISLAVARRLVVFLKRPGGQSQYSIPLKAQSARGPLARLMAWVTENPAEDLRVQHLAEYVGLGERTLFRLFRETVGSTPALWIEEVRTECARRLLEDSAKPVDAIASEVGFGSAERLRRVFVRRFGVPPNTYRQRFSSPPPKP